MMEWITLLGGGVTAAAFGYLLGRRGRILDFRFEIFQKCSLAYRNALLELGVVHDEAISDFDRSGHMAQPERAERWSIKLTEADRAIMQCAALGTIVERLFSEETWSEWNSTLDEIKGWRRALDEPSYDSFHPGGIKALAFPRFARSAAEDCGLGFWGKVRRVVRGDWEGQKDGPSL